jgi:tetratricopeptide (TPR) repeat protein
MDVSALTVNEIIVSAKMMLDKGNYRGAIAAVEPLVQKKRRKTLSLNQEFNVVDVLGRCYQALLDFKSARPHVKRLLKLTIKHFGKGSKEHAIASTGLGSIERELKNYSLAKIQFNKGLAILVELGEEKSLEYGSLLSNITEIDFEQNQWTEALEGYIKAKVVLDNFKEKDNYGALVNNMAICYYHLNRWAEALACNQEAVELARNIHGNQHPDYATSVFNLAVAYVDIKQVEFSIPLFEESLAIRKRVFGDGHPATISIIKELAHVRDYLSKDRKAIKTTADVRMCNSCLKIDKSVHMLCSCKKVNYCNTECQGAHWAKHAPYCIVCYGCGMVRGTDDEMVRCTTCLIAKYCNESCRDGSKDGHACVDRCYQCRKTVENLLECSVCHIAKYCSVECQRTHWKTEHKTQCQKKGLQKY